MKDVAFASIILKLKKKMIKVRLQIGDGPIENTSDKHSLVYLSSDTFFSAPLRSFESSKYPEQDGENIHPATVYEPFDYKVKFFVQAEPGLNNANQKIAAFNNLLYTKDASGLKTFKRVIFYNDYKKVKIVGYPSLIKEATEDDFWRDSRGNVADVVCVEWSIRVDKPQECDFNLIEE